MAGVVEMDELGFDETELRLCLPGGEVGRGTAKRVFMAERIDLKLNLHTPDSKQDDDVEVATSVDKLKRPANLRPSTNDPEDQSPASKAQVVGWPPVRSFRKNIMTVHSEKGRKEDGEKSKNGMTAGYVKVSMDGAPYLRKVDLKVYKSYQELSLAMENMFSSFTVGKCGSQGMNGKDLKNESKLMGLLNGSEYVPTYEDKDGDWMLVGDVPWQMFVESCKRLRIMKGSDAIGLAPRAMEKCKNKI